MYGNIRNYAAAEYRSLTVALVPGIFAVQMAAVAFTITSGAPE